MAGEVWAAGRGAVAPVAWVGMAGLLDGAEALLAAKLPVLPRFRLGSLSLNDIAGVG